MKVGISAVSIEGARKNLEAEIPHWDFDEVKDEAKETWNKELGKIEVNGGTKEQKITFYSALYHSFLVPNLFMDVDGQYRGSDLKFMRQRVLTIILYFHCGILFVGNILCLP